MEKLNLPDYDYTLRRTQNGHRIILDPIRKRFVPLTPEEWVRQHFVQFLIRHLKVPPASIRIEVSIPIPKKDPPFYLRADIVIYNRNFQPVMIVECKRSSVQLTQDTFNQIARYNATLKVPYLVITNGMEYNCCIVDQTNQTWHLIEEIPHYQTLILPINANQ